MLLDTYNAQKNASIIYLGLDLTHKSWDNNGSYHTMHHAALPLTTILQIAICKDRGAGHRTVIITAGSGSKQHCEKKEPTIASRGGVHHGWAK